MIERIYISFLLSLLCIFSFAQEKFIYTPLKSEGEIPSDFLGLSSLKFETDKSRIDKKTKRAIRKSKERFYLKSNYYLEELLHSGKVIFNDAASVYSKKVLEKILKTDTSLFGKIRIYTLKTPAVNAFAFDNGIILVTLGLLAQLENEAQLAYILSHEIIHYKNKHSMNAYVEYEQIESTYRRTSGDEKILARSAYSKELESEADEQGLDLFLKSDYSIDELNGVFDVLQYSYLPFDDVPFETKLFETGYFNFPSEYFLKKTAGIKGEEEYDDSKSNHPNIKKRRRKIISLTSEVSNSGRQKFIVSERGFLKVRETARYEISQMYLSDCDYGNAFYNSYLLHLLHPEDFFAKKFIAKSLYGMVKYKNKNMGFKVISDFDKIEGQSQQVFHFFKEIKPEELNSIALDYVWKLHQQKPEDEYLSDIAKELMKDLVYEHKLMPKDFHQKLKEEVENNEVENEKKDLSKYDKIKSQKENVSSEKNDFYFKYVLIDCFSDSSFSSAFNECAENFDKEKKEKEKFVSSRELRKKERNDKKEKRMKRKKGEALGIDKIVILNPHYNISDQRKKDAIRYLDSETSQIDYTEKLSLTSSITGLETTMIDFKKFSPENVNMFNDISLLNNWISERIYHDELKIKVSTSEEIKNLISSHNTRYFAWTGIIAARKRNDAAAYFTCLSCFAPFMFPFVFAYALSPKYDTIYYFVLMDIESGEEKLGDKFLFHYGDRSDILNSYIYNSMYQIKNKCEKK